MMFFILSLILICIGAIGFILTLNYNTFSDTTAIVCVTLFYVGVIIILFCAIDKDINPTAMDVYRNRTTIEITYKDGVAIDTVVVFKSKKWMNLLNI